MDTISSLLVITLAALIHASFQLSVSMLTLLSSHTIGTKARHQKLLRLTNSFGFGVAVMTLLLLSATSFVLQHFFTQQTPELVWAIVCGAMVGLGLAIWMFYYRRGTGTSLWLPRGMARYLTERSKATRLSGEAFGLGLSSVLAEIIFIATPIVVASLMLIRLEPLYQLVGLALYVGVSMFTLMIVSILISSGHRISRIQRWREANKRFLQYTAGTGLFVLGFYLYVDQILSHDILAMSGALH